MSVNMKKVEPDGKARCGDGAAIPPGLSML
jgi:hypothetical protein